MTAPAGAARAPLLDVAQVSLSFHAVRAIADVSFTVAAHEICALIGPNGAGKSSLLNLVGGFYPPDAGSIGFGGQRYARLWPHRAAKLGIARTFQNIGLFRGMSVLDNVIAGRNLQRRATFIEQALGIGRAPREERQQRWAAERIIHFLRLHLYRHRIVGTLPYGVQKQVELARALAAEPRLLLLDEPMAGLNAEEKAEMSRHILDVNREMGTTVLLIEHDMNVVMDISDQVVVLDHGRKIAHGTPDEVRADPKVIRAYLGAAADAGAPARVATPVPRGAPTATTSAGAGIAP